MPDAQPILRAGALSSGSGVEPPPERMRFSLRSLLIVTACVAVAVAGGVELKRRADQAARNARDAELRERIPAILNTLGSCLAYYGNGSTEKGQVKRGAQPWPPQIPLLRGRPAHSWRLPIATYLSLQCLCEDEPWPNLEAAWDDRQNLDYVASTGYLFSLGKPRTDSRTHVFGITGTDSAFDGASASSFADLPADVILAMEFRDSEIECFEPGDYNIADLLAYRGKIGDHLHGLLEGRLHVLFADGEVWALDPSAPIADLQPFLTITGAKSHDRDQLLAPHRVD